MTAAALSCMREEKPPVILDDKGGDVATLRVSVLERDETKSPGEEDIATLQIMVFDGNGIMEASLYADDWDGEEEMTVTSGAKRICLVANYPEMEGINTYGDLERVVFTFQECSPEANGGFLMTSEISTELRPGRNRLEATLRRRVSKICLSPIDLSGMNPALRGKISFRAAFLTNVRKSVSFGGQTAPDVSEFCYKVGCDSLGRAIDALGGAFRPAWGTFGCLSLKDLAKEGGSLYCFPNNLDGSVEDYSGTVPESFTPSRTKLVVQAVTSSGKVWYYPLRLPAPLLDNHTYTINLSVSGPGSDHPDIIPEYGSYSARLSVNPWVHGATYTENL